MIVPVFNPGPDIDDCIALAARPDAAARGARADLRRRRVDRRHAARGSTRWPAEHAHVRVEHIPNSGWPGSPRNLGLEHGPRRLRALRRQRRLARAATRSSACTRWPSRTGADIVIGKVVGHGKQRAARRCSRATATASASTAPSCSRLLTPHKLFRRAPARGARRCASRRAGAGSRTTSFVRRAPTSRAERISVLADRPVYHWVRRERAATPPTRRFDARRLLRQRARGARPGRGATPSPARCATRCCCTGTAARCSAASAARSCLLARRRSAAASCSRRSARSRSERFGEDVARAAAVQPAAALAAAARAATSTRSARLVALRAAAAARRAHPRDRARRHASRRCALESWLGSPGARCASSAAATGRSGSRRRRSCAEALAGEDRDVTGELRRASRRRAPAQRRRRTRVPRCPRAPRCKLEGGADDRARAPAAARRRRRSRRPPPRPAGRCPPGRWEVRVARHGRRASRARAGPARRASRSCSSRPTRPAGSSVGDAPPPPPAPPSRVYRRLPRAGDRTVSGRGQEPSQPPAADAPEVAAHGAPQVARSRPRAASPGRAGRAAPATRATASTASGSSTPRRSSTSAGTCCGSGHDDLARASRRSACAAPGSPGRGRARAAGRSAACRRAGRSGPGGGGRGSPSTL